MDTVGLTAAAVVVIFFGVLLTSAYVIFAIGRRRLVRRSLGEVQEAAEPTTLNSGEAPTKIDLSLKIPEALLTACVQRRCVLFGGNSLGVQAGYPSWPDALATVIREIPNLRQEERLALESSLSAGKINVVTEFLISRSRSDVIGTAKALYGGSPTSLPSLIKDLQSIPFVGVLTTHWHDLLTVALAHRRPKVFAVGVSDTPSISICLPV